MVRPSSQRVPILLAQLLGVNALDLGPLHRLAQLRLATKEARMEIGAFVGTASHAVKAPHVELPLEALVLGLVEVFGHDVFVKGFSFVDLEAILGWNPRDDIVEALRVGIVQDAVEFPWEFNSGGELLLTGITVVTALDVRSIAHRALLVLPGICWQHVDNDDLDGLSSGKWL